jgi:cell division septation protein DedD
VRTLLALTLVIVACGPVDGRDRASASDGRPSASTSGPDPIMLRVPRDGGVVRAFAYPGLDSLIWRSSGRAPALSRILAFDQEAGSIAYVAENGVPGRIDLRLGAVQSAGKVALSHPASDDGDAIFGLSKNTVTRLTPAGDWTLTPGDSVLLALPQGDGALIVLLKREDGHALLRLHPPESRITDSLELRDIDPTVYAQAGDRVYFASGDGLQAVEAADLTTVSRVELSGVPVAIAPTPSGDRVYAAIVDEPLIDVVDRYENGVVRRLKIPGLPGALRMDPLGRYLLVRAAVGDSAWVIPIGTHEPIGSIQTAWRGDLPLVAPDGAILVARGDNVAFVNSESLRDRRVIRGGASDFWYAIRWNGFRPRAEGLDEPVDFAVSQSDGVAGDAGVDSTGAPVSPRVTRRGDSTRPVGGRDTVARTAPTPPPRPAEPAFTVSFAALLDAAAARELAQSITVDGARARVVTSTTAGSTVHRVVLGPYPSRAEAERVGRDSGKNYWVYEGLP